MRETGQYKEYKTLIRYVDKRKVIGKMKLGIIGYSAKSTGKTGFVIGFN